MLPIQPTPFFSSKNRAFWILQSAGWGGAFLLRSVSALANDRPWDLLVVILVATITSFSISLILSVIYRRLINRRAFVTWVSTVVVLFIAVGVQATLDALVQGVYYGVSRETTFAQRFIGLSYIPMTLLGGWSALYYAINYFLTVEAQADRLQRLEAETTSAQLAMLRYQLNPHFLFNTLNSISTLVLLKQNKQADAMLSRLSSFLRHTLIAEPGSQMTVDQEIETLKLYLDIERMRFEDRLRTHFEIEEAARDAMLPSMLLQPLVENAIKYAVSPLEEGARISVSARIIGNRLRMSVADSGPGAEGPEQRSLFDPSADATNRHVSTGVGLTNIRNRLQQAYGLEHVFDIKSEPGGGFEVIIEIPFQRARESASEPAAESAANGSPAPAAPSQDTAAEPEPKPSGESATVISLNPGRTLGSSA